MTVRTLPILAAVVMALALTGCASTAAGTGTAASELPTSEPATTPAAPSSASPSAAPQPDIDDPASWTLSATGFGPVLVGAEFDPGTTELGPYIRVTPDCADAHVLRFDGDGLGRFQVILEKGGSRIDAVMVAPGPTGDVLQSTETGITVGSGLTALLAAHPDAQLTREWPDGGTYAIADGTIWLTFAVDDGHVRAIAASSSNSPFQEYCA